MIQIKDKPAFVRLNSAVMKRNKRLGWVCRINIHQGDITNKVIAQGLKRRYDYKLLEAFGTEVSLYKFCTGVHR